MELVPFNYFMAITTCSECSNTVSTKAAACPHCGAPITPGCAREEPPESLPSPTQAKLADSSYRFSVTADTFWRCAIGISSFAVVTLVVCFGATLIFDANLPFLSLFLLFIIVAVWTLFYRGCLRGFGLRPESVVKFRDVVKLLCVGGLLVIVGGLGFLVFYHFSSDRPTPANAFPNPPTTSQVQRQRRTIGSPATPIPSPANAQDKAAVTAATNDAPFVNSLGMEFVPVPGTKVLMCRTETRVRDFRAYAKAAGYQQGGGAFVMKVKKDKDGDFSVAWELDKSASWEEPGFAQSGEHPVTCVKWEEARAFCAWLSKKEGRTYRLPEDAEWSAAVGLQKYPWGADWPAPNGAGNYSGAEFWKSLPGGGWNKAYDYSDGAERTAEVASYRANRLGIFDLGGNVWEWCEDEYKATMNSAEARKASPVLEKEKASDGTPFRGVRGGSWDSDDEIILRSSFRINALPSNRFDNRGFRCVLMVSGG